MRILGTLILTHSSRRTNPLRCTVGFLTRRFQDPTRLQTLPPFETLAPAAPLYSGAVSFYRLLQGRGALQVRALGYIHHRDKLQHVVAVDEHTLLAGFEHRLEHWRLPVPLDRVQRLSNASIEVTGRLEHPWLAGLHTVSLLSNGRAALACSAPDAVLIADLASGAIETVLAMPTTHYGQGYALKPGMDLRQHYIDDEAQTTHLNAATFDATCTRLVVSTLIQGAVGMFTGEDGRFDGTYHELTRGFVGCHGARFAADGSIYFTDSTVGALVWLRADGGMARRFALPSRWLHDTQQITDNLYAFALADHNRLEIHDVERGVCLHRQRFLTWPVEGLFPLARRWPRWLGRWPGWLGNSTQALSFHPAADS